MTDFVKEDHARARECLFAECVTCVTCVTCAPDINHLWPARRACDRGVRHLADGAGHGPLFLNPRGGGCRKGASSLTDSAHLPHCAIA